MVQPCSESDVRYSTRMMSNDDIKYDDGVVPLS
jgi:hypothetical protein